MFFEPGSNRPNNFFYLYLAFCLFGTYLIANREKASTEINYQDFVNLYLVKNNVSIITLSENKDNSAFKFKATITTNDGAKYHIVLPQVENFLFRLDQT